MDVDSKRDELPFAACDVPDEKEEKCAPQPKSAQRRKADAATATRCNTFLLVLEQPSSPENFGAVLRCVDACGVGKVYVVTHDDSPLAHFIRTHPLGRPNAKHRLTVPAMGRFVQYNESTSDVKEEKRADTSDVATFDVKISEHKTSLHALRVVPSTSTAPSAKDTSKMKKKKKKKDDVSAKVKKTAASAERWVYVRTFPTTRDCLAHLAKNKWSSLVTSPHISNKPNIELSQGNYTVYRKLAVWMGNEVHGISSEAIEHACGAIQIPMRGHVESLNLACATTLVVHTICDQRRDFTAASRFVPIVRRPFDHAIMTSDLGHFFFCVWHVYVT
jgi:tRNA G18 (ribose-2'-O)-methylase SpoU